MRVLEWNPGEPMTEEYALSVVDGMKQFIRARYYMPQKQDFNGKVDFEARLQELDGLKVYIKTLLFQEQRANHWHKIATVLFFIIGFLITLLARVISS